MVVLHLFPGLIMMLLFVALAYLARGSELPPIFWFSVAIPLGIIPAELGYLFYLGYQRNGRFSLEGIVAYGRPLNWKQYLWMVPVTFISMIVLITVAGLADVTIYNTLFGWWPHWMNMSLVDPNKWVKPIVIVVTMLFANILGPIVEEIYFRGYLLPRLSRFGRWGILLNTFLFALYHFWSPWHLIQRTVGSLPFALSAKYGNLNVAIITHVLANSVGFLLTLAALASA